MNGGYASTSEYSLPKSTIGVHIKESLINITHIGNRFKESIDNIQDFLTAKPQNMMATRWNFQEQSLHKKKVEFDCIKDALSRHRKQ